MIVEALLWTCAGLGAAILMINYWSIRSAARSSAHVTSRFPLFAVRDELRHALIDGDLEAGDAAVSLFDVIINELLKLDNRDNLSDFLQRHFRSRLRELQDSEYAAKKSASLALLTAKVQESPIFGRIMSHSDMAIGQMLQDRTSWLSFHGCILRLQMAKLSFAVLLKCKQLLSFSDIRTADLSFARKTA